MSENGLPRRCASRNDGGDYHPCRYCTDKAVCRGECAKASAYINQSRREFAEQMAAQRKKREGTDCHVGRRPPRNDG